jgi:nucleoside phosphorylase
MKTMVALVVLNLIILGGCGGGSSNSLKVGDKIIFAAIYEDIDVNNLNKKGSQVGEYYVSKIEKVDGPKISYLDWMVLAAR